MSVYPSAAAEVTVVDRPPTAPATTQYVAHRPPLQPAGLVRLPVGSVRPDGWLKKMLRLQADGFHGKLGELSPWLKKMNNAWLSRDGKGDHGWEEVPYWLKGYLNCAYALGDEKMIAEAHTWVKAAMDSQQADGWFGPGEGRKGEATDLVGRADLWPNMVMLFCLQDYYEKTGDRRALDVMTRYFRYLNGIPEKNFLVGYWPSMRGGDQIYSALWLYNHTGDKFLLDVARKTHRKTARWDTGLINLHNVNVAQAFREPAIYAVLSGKDSDTAATERVWQTVRRRFGQVPGGMFGADENAREGYTGPRQAIETCGIVEEMLSDELLIALTGDPTWAERCENAAFNSLPAAFTPDFRGLRYLTAPNHPQSDHHNKAPGVENGGDMFGMNPYGHRCCQHNGGHGWPYLNHHLWYAAAGDGLAVYLYAPCSMTAKVAGGVEVRINEATRYPFEETVTFTVQPAKAVRFPLYLRIPAWCQKASLSVNGTKTDVTLPAGKVACVDREWKAGDKVELALPMTPAVRVWTGNRNTVSVDRGPLTYSLLIKEKYVRYGGSDTWPAFDILPDSPWNYGLEIDPAKPEASLKVVHTDWPADDRPFTHAAPVRIEAKARKIPNWTLDQRGLVREVVPGPIKSDEPVETVTLIPMGAARLRITAFPRISNGPDGKEWPAPLQSRYKVSASHCNESDQLEALCDGIVPKSSDDHSIERFTWWPRKGSKEWAQYDFAKPTAVSGASVYWFDDEPRGGCRLPQSWRLLYRDGKTWKPIEAVYPVAKDRLCVVTFKPVVTTALRLEVQLRDGFSGGVLEWELRPIPSAGSQRSQ
ncbi:MAG: glycoside hydrolase family 127 protein [Gemmataceae bacterium]